MAGNLQNFLRDRQNKEYAIISIDDFLKMSKNNEIYEDDVFEISSKLCEKAVEMLHLVHGVIIDHVITSERIFYQLTESLRAYDISLIHVTCPLLELERREKERNNRCLGSAKASYEFLFPKGNYDLTIDTFQLSSEECLLKIIDIVG